MASSHQNLFGLWKMTAMRWQEEGTRWESETVFGGMSLFTAQGQILTFTRTSEIPFGYSGTFVLKGDELVIQPEVCSLPELERTTYTRTVKKLSDRMLTLGMTDHATGRLYEIDFELVTRSFT